MLLAVTADTGFSLSSSRICIPRWEGIYFARQLLSIIMPCKYIDGYQPQAYNLAKTLVGDPEKNVFIFTYTPILPGTVVTKALDPGEKLTSLMSLHRQL